MRTKSTGGFTLIELLIVIAIIGILAAVLIPNLLSARERAFDTAAQTCLKEIATHEEMRASVDPWLYSDGTVHVNTPTNTDPNTATPEIASCDNVIVVSATHSDGTAGTDTGTYAYNAAHRSGGNVYNIELGGGVKHNGEYDATDGVPTTAP